MLACLQQFALMRIGLEEQQCLHQTGCIECTQSGAAECIGLRLLCSFPLVSARHAPSEVQDAS